MKKQTLVLVVVMVVAVIAGTVLAGILNSQRSALIPEQSAMQKMPIGGLHKFAADVEWMLFVNYMGGIDEVNEKNVDEVTRRLEKLIRLDPNLEQLYRDGVSFLTYADPEKALSMFKNACKNKHLAKSAEIPFYTGLLMIRNLKQPDYEGAAEFFQMAMNRNGGANSIIPLSAKRHYYQCKAKILAADAKLDDRQAMAEVLYKALKSNENSIETENTTVREFLLQALQNIQNPEEDYTPTKKAIQRAKEISTLAFANSHLCENCMSTYQQGQKFCSNCGSNVKVYGTCVKCGQVVNGNFCTNCGTSAKEVKPEATACPKAEAKKAACPKAEAKKAACPKAEAKKAACPKAEAKKAAESATK